MEISGRVQDRIKVHLDSWFIGLTKACQKISEFNIHGNSLAVQYLFVHLPNEHYINFYAHQTVNEVLARQNIEKTQLTAQFNYNSVYDNGLDFIYQQFPQHCTWNAKAKLWYPRQCSKIIGRMYFVLSSKREQFFLQLLLTVFEGGKSWEYLRTWNSQVFVTFKKVCMTRGLLEDDHEQRICLEKAIAIQPRIACCQLLVVILLTDKVAEPYILWNQFKTGLYNNIKHKLCYMSYYQADQEIPEDDVYDYSLWNLNRILVGIGKSLAEFPPMPLSQQEQSYRVPNPLLQAEQYDADEIATLVNKQRAIFNPEQATVFDTVLESITNNQSHIFFIHTAGGCEKTFLCNTIVAEIRRRGQVALCIISSEIAALLLDRRRTFHSLFKISISIYKDSVAGLKYNSYMFSVIQQTKVIIQNEVSMQYKYAIDAVD